MTEAELRARIRELMASGVLPSELPIVAHRGSQDLGVKNPLPNACFICGDRDPQISLFYTAGRMVRLHAACEALWQQERQK